MRHRDFLKALQLVGDPHGMRVLLLLRDKGPLAVSEIVASFRSPPVAQPIVSRTLKKLRGEKLVRAVRQGTRTRYDLNHAVFGELVSQLQESFPVGREVRGVMEGEEGPM